MRYLWIVFFIIGCSHHDNHLDIAQYHLVKLKKSPNMPSKEEFESRKNMKVIVLKIEQKDNKNSNIGYALTKELSSRLVSYRTIEVIERFSKTNVIKEHQIYEAVKEDESNLENADYRIQGDIISINQNTRFHKGWSSIETCIAGNINLFKLPSQKMEDSFHFDECIYERYNKPTPRDNRKNYPELITKAIPEIIDSVLPKLAKAFKPKGYIEAMRTNGDKKIIKTTLNKTLGAIEGREVQIIKIEKEKNITGEDDIIEIPIGSGTISNIITDSYSFVIIDELKEEIHLGDIVKIK